MQLNERLWQLTQERFGRSPDQCDDHQLYEALLLLTRALAQDRPAPPGDRKLYYFSAEFLTGKLLSNNLLALGLHQPLGHHPGEVGVHRGAAPARLRAQALHPFPPDQQFCSCIFL